TVESSLDGRAADIRIQLRTVPWAEWQGRRTCAGYRNPARGGATIGSRAVESVARRGPLKRNASVCHARYRETFASIELFAVFAGQRQNVRCNGKYFGRKNTFRRQGWLF